MEEYDDSEAQHFADTEEEAHFYAVMSDFLDLLDDYSPHFVMMTMWVMMKEKEGTLNSIN